MQYHCEPGAYCRRMAAGDFRAARRAAAARLQVAGHEVVGQPTAPLVAGIELVAPEMLPHAQQRVGAFEGRVRGATGGDGKGLVLDTGLDQQWTRRDQRGHVGEVGPRQQAGDELGTAELPIQGVDLIGIEVAADDRSLDTVVESGQERSPSAAVGQPGAADPLRVHVGPRPQQVNAALVVVDREGEKRPAE